MPPKRILITGASGCIGHYIAEALIQETHHELFLVVRDPSKLKFDYQARPGITLLKADLRELEQFKDLLQTINCAVLVATAWGGAQEVVEVNVNATLQLLSLLSLSACQQVLYFSTASILGRDGELLKEAGEIGIDYVRSKYVCLQQLSQLAIAPRITTLFPTLVLGGDEQKPYSHLTKGLPEVLRWIDLIRFLKAEGSFHFIYAQDIAHVVKYLIEQPQELLPQKLVLGNQRVTFNQCIEEFCTYLNKRVYFRVNLSPWLANFFINLFQIQMAAWDHFCMNYRHFSYQNPVSPAIFGLPTYCETPADILRVAGIAGGSGRAKAKSQHKKSPSI